MRYLGNKTKHLDFILQSILESTIELTNPIIADLFGGTGSVSNHFTPLDI